MFKNITNLPSNFKTLDYYFNFNKECNLSFVLLDEKLINNVVNNCKKKQIK